MKNFFLTKKKQIFFLKNLNLLKNVFINKKCIKNKKGDLVEMTFSLKWLFSLNENVNDIKYNNNINFLGKNSKIPLKEIDNFEYYKYLNYDKIDFKNKFGKNYIFNFDKNQKYNKLNNINCSIIGGLNKLYLNETDLAFSKFISKKNFSKKLFNKSLTNLKLGPFKKRILKNSLLKYSFFTDFSLTTSRNYKNTFNLFLLKFFSKCIYYTNTRKFENTNYYHKFNNNILICNNNNYWANNLNFFSNYNFNNFSNLNVNILILKGYFLNFKSMNLSMYDTFNVYTNKTYNLLNFNILKFNSLIFISLFLNNYFLIKSNNDCIITNIEFIHYLNKLFYNKILLNNIQYLNNWKKYLSNFFLFYKIFFKKFYKIKKNYLNIFFKIKIFTKFNINNNIFKYLNFKEISNEHFDVLIYRNNLYNLYKLYYNFNVLKNNFFIKILNYDYLYKFFSSFSNLEILNKKNILSNLKKYNLIFFKNIFKKNIFFGCIFFNIKSKFFLEKSYDFYISLYFLYILKIFFLLKVNEFENKYFFKKFSWFLTNRSKKLKKGLNYDFFNTLNDFDNVSYTRPFFWLKNKNINNTFYFLLSNPFFLLKFIFNLFSLNERFVFFNKEKNFNLNLNNLNYFYFKLFKSKFITHSENDFKYNQYLFENMINESFIKNKIFLNKNFFWKNQTILQQRISINNSMGINNVCLDFFKPTQKIIYNFIDFDFMQYFNGKLLNYLDFPYINNLTEYDKYSELFLSSGNIFNFLWQVGLSYSHFSFFSFFSYLNNKNFKRILKNELFVGKSNLLQRSFFGNLNYVLLNNDSIKYHNSTEFDEKNIYDDFYENWDSLNIKTNKAEAHVTMFLNGNIYYNPLFLTKYELLNKKNHFFFNNFDSYYINNKNLTINFENKYLNNLCIMDKCLLDKCLIYNLHLNDFFFKKDFKKNKFIDYNYNFFYKKYILNFFYFE